MSDLAAIVLAAGAGHRFGAPKALARWRGRTWLALALANLSEAGFDSIVVVIGAQAARVRQEAQTEVDSAWHEQMAGSGCADLRWVTNAQWQAGRSGSLARGISALDAGMRGALIHAVDHPLVQVSTFAGLARAFSQSASPTRRIFVPRFAGQRGHPILIGSMIWPEIQALGADEPLRQVVHRDPGRIHEVPVDDAGIHGNVNRREQWEAHVQGHGERSSERQE